MAEESKDKGFVIKDKRFFDDRGEVRAESPAQEEKEKPRQEETYLPEPTFSNFILSLSTTAMYHFGDFPDPVTKEKKVNLQAARHTIDLLAMLKTKTEGNLDENEKSLLDGLLFELRLRYVKEAESHK
jgi:hypothetical protein